MYYFWSFGHSVFEFSNFDIRILAEYDFAFRHYIVQDKKLSMSIFEGKWGAQWLCVRCSMNVVNIRGYCD